MGREIRRVPPNWEHPLAECRHIPQCITTAPIWPCNHSGRHYRPCFDHDYEEASAKWIAGFIDWHVNGNASGDYPYWEYSNPPDKDTCRPKFTAEPTWLQVYETVSEGTPVTPPFPSAEELARYLSENGDFWYQRDIEENGASRYRSKPDYEAALRFVTSGWAPSLIVAAGKISGPYG